MYWIICTKFYVSVFTDSRNNYPVYTIEILQIIFICHRNFFFHASNVKRSPNPNPNNERFVHLLLVRFSHLWLVRSTNSIEIEKFRDVDIFLSRHNWFTATWILGTFQIARNSFWLYNSVFVCDENLISMKNGDIIRGNIGTKRGKWEKRRLEEFNIILVIRCCKYRRAISRFD